MGQRSYKTAYWYAIISLVEPEPGPERQETATFCLSITGTGTVRNFGSEEQGRTVQDTAEQCRTAQDSAGQHITGQESEERSMTVQDNT
jgi:hypothetical protein